MYQDVCNQPPPEQLIHINIYSL